MVLWEEEIRLECCRRNVTPLWPFTFKEGIECDWHVIPSFSIKVARKVAIKRLGKDEKRPIAWKTFLFFMADRIPAGMPIWNAGAEDKRRKCCRRWVDYWFRIDYLMEEATLGMLWRTDVQISCSPGPTALIYNVHHDYCSNAMPAVKFNRPLRLIALQFHQLLCPRIAGVMLGNFLIIRRPFSFLFWIFLSSSLCRPRDCRLLKVSDPRWPHVTCQPEFVADQFKVISAAQGDSSDIFNFHKFI